MPKHSPNVLPYCGFVWKVEVCKLVGESLSYSFLCFLVHPPSVSLSRIMGWISLISASFHMTEDASESYCSKLANDLVCTQTGDAVVTLWVSQSGGTGC